jgi:hypothetical protein
LFIKGIKTKTEEHFKQVQLSLPEGSMESTITSVDHKNEEDDENDYDNEKHSYISKQYSSRFDSDRKQASYNSEHTALSTDRRGSIHSKANDRASPYRLNETEEQKNNETFYGTKGEHLLSKGLF